MNPPSDETLFAEALARPPAERAGYLEQACGTDAALRARVETLLGVVEKAGSFMETSPVDRDASTQRAVSARARPKEKPGDRIGRYKLLQRLGEGGCGVVYVAEQEEPVRRRVALKVIKLGMDTREVIARFEAERQALALMDHPNIAKVFDAGATDTGRPYFVMELVRGIPLTKYCDEHNAKTTERLELFIQICHAVQHAHQKGIIHRDLKPSNILVTINDGVAVPKIIDFGIAKATQGRLTDKTVYTAFEQFIGTPAYMSPEQAVMTSLDIDTRSDIYSLGVLLYELLTGRTPFDAKEMLAAGLDEIRRRIREVEPPKPSTRLSTMEGDALTTTARLRQTEAPKLLSLVRGDLDWIVMRCLEKDRTRRYDTANGLAEDIRRHLANEPVSASPPSAAYRFQKLVRRNKLVFAAAAGIAAALLIGAAVATWQAVRATRAELRARAERDAADRARQAEATARALAEQRRTEVETINKLLLSDTLSRADPEFAHDPDIKLRAVLDSAALRIPQAFAANPLLEAAIRSTIGQTYSNLSLWEKADPHLRAAWETRRRLLGEEHPDTLSAWRDVGTLLERQLRTEEAEQVLNQLLPIQERVLGPDHEETLKTLNEIFYTKNIRTQLQVPSAKSLPLVEESERFARAAYEKALKRFGPEHPLTITHLQNIQSALCRGGKVDEAAKIAADVLALRHRLLGPNHPDTIYSMIEQATATSDPALREQQLRKCLAHIEKVMGSENVYYGIVARQLGMQLSAAGRVNEAGEFWLRATAVWPRIFGMECRSTPSLLIEAGIMLVEIKLVNAAADFALEWIPETRRRYSVDCPGLGGLLFILGSARLAQGRPAAAEAALRESVPIQDKHVGMVAPKNAERFITRSLLGAALLAQKKFAEAEPWLVAGFEGVKERQAHLGLSGERQLRLAADRLVQLYTDWDQPAKAAEWKESREALGPMPTRSAPPRAVSEAKLEKSASIDLSFDRPKAGEPAATAEGAMPVGWGKVGSRPSYYEVRVDRAHPHRKPISVCVRSLIPESAWFGGLNKGFAAEEYRGKRVRFRAWIKTAGVEGLAPLFLRVDPPEGRSVAFDNMAGRAPSGTTDWTEYAIVLDVPPEGARIVLGFFLSGTGQAWINDPQFEIVGTDVPPTKPAATPAAAKTGQ